jgi:hypothetical protein
VVVLLHKQFRFTPSPLILPALSQIVYMLLLASLTLQYMEHFIHPFLCQLIASNLSSVPAVCHHLFTCIALGDADLLFSVMLTKASAVEEETKLAT